MHGDSGRPWWHGAVIYQIYPLSFADANGDGYGDLPGVLAHLDHVAALGADAVWLSPVFRSPMADWGYDIASHTEIDPLFGTLADMDAVIAQAHALGLRVLLDQVWGHTSNRHPWFTDSRRSRTGERADWYVWADPAADGTPPNNWLSVFGGAAWSWEPRRRQYYLHHFLSSQPKLDLRNPAVRSALLEAGRFWLDRGIDGFRLDAVDFLLHDKALRSNPANPPVDGVIPLKPFGMQHHVHDMMLPDAAELLHDIRKLADAYPGTVLLGELSSQPGAHGRIGTYAGPGGLHLGYTLQLLKGELSAERLAAILAEGGRAIADFAVCWSFGNHDVVRAATRWGGEGTDAPARCRLAMRLFASLPGALGIYQGDELFLRESVLAPGQLRDPFGIAYWPEFAGRDGCRTPMPWRHDRPNAGFGDAASPWLPVPVAHYPLAADLQAADPESALSAWHACLAERRDTPALRYGTLANVTAADGVLTFERVLDGRRIFCAFNLTGGTRRVTPAAHAALDLGPWECRRVGAELPVALDAAQ